MRRQCVAALYFGFWHFAKSVCHAKLGRYRGMADIEQALTPFNLAEATDWFALPL
jgi:hypothetical protein